MLEKLSPTTRPKPDETPSIKYLDALDDLAVGLEQTGQSDEAMAILQKKLVLVSPLPAPPATRPAYVRANPNWPEIKRVDLDKILAAQNLTPIQHHQYTTFANLGTILLLDVLPKFLAGNTDPIIKSQIQQSLDYIERAIAINPGGHFGREVWQAILIEHLLAAFDHSDLLTQYDMIGEQVDSLGERRGGWDYGRRPLNLSDPKISADERVSIRSSIDPFGDAIVWAQLVNPDYTSPMPFDEPTLAIIGMWTIGGGPNPHFALALGRIMESIGQLHISWNAYERAVELKDGFWPDPAIREKMVAICRSQQDKIARLEEPTNPTGWQDKMRKQHQSELAWGLAYQKEYQDFEASRIAAGVSLNDPNFYTPFFQTHPSIASAPGLSDDAIVTQLKANSWLDLLPCLILAFGIGMALALVVPEKVLS